ncbi:MAG TPA: exosortase/archaeosortase family protein [Candidatus Omnitrophota bacterium]|nr:exosortase/archaeosortase family protein [Candidatus Omnitrophota bacterium]HRZ14834.1 exosortase/archaeosortase family protein [Candidatus Omnitrophota bacterium]
MKKDLVGKLAVLAILVAIIYIPTFIWMFNSWNVADSYYSHGPLVPLIAIFIFWLKRKQLKSLKIKPSHAGWLFLTPGIFIQLLSAVWRVNFTSGISLLLVIPGIVLLFLGPSVLRLLWFPIAFLTFMLPLPMVAIANISFKLKIFAAQMATWMVNAMGIPAIREGSVIKTHNAHLTVEDPCSGIRSLIALIALGALMAYFSRLSRPKKLILFAASLPIAVLANVIRIIVLTLVSEIYGMHLATGFFHDMMGYAVFALAFFGLAFVAKIME